jgi:hypothetical protein
VAAPVLVPDFCRSVWFELWLDVNPGKFRRGEVQRPDRFGNILSMFWVARLHIEIVMPEKDGSLFDEFRKIRTPIELFIGKFLDRSENSFLDRRLLGELGDVMSLVEFTKDALK